MRTRDRYHIDVVLVVGSFLYLIELKCRLSESGGDLEKLRDIRGTYTVDELLSLIRRRATAALDLSAVRTIVLGIGFEVCDRTEVPADFVLLCTATEPPEIRAGVKVVVEAVDALR